MSLPSVSSNSGQSNAKSALGQSPQDLIDQLDKQQQQLQRIQARDSARLATLTPGSSQYHALESQISDRAANIADIDVLRDRLNSGEHPSIVQRDMARQGAVMLQADDRAILEKAAAPLDVAALEQTRAQRLEAYDRMIVQAHMKIDATSGYAAAMVMADNNILSGQAPASGLRQQLLSHLKPEDPDLFQQNKQAANHELMAFLEDGPDYKGDIPVNPATLALRDQILKAEAELQDLYAKRNAILDMSPDELAADPSGPALDQISKKAAQKVALSERLTDLQAVQKQVGETKAGLESQLQALEQQKKDLQKGRSLIGRLNDWRKQDSQSPLGQVQQEIKALEAQIKKVTAEQDAVAADIQQVKAEFQALDRDLGVAVNQQIQAAANTPAVSPVPAANKIPVSTPPSPQVPVSTPAVQQAPQATVSVASGGTKTDDVAAPQVAMDQAGPDTAPIAVQGDLENEIRNTEAALANIEAQINDPSKRSSSSNQSPDADNLPELLQRQAEKQKQLEALKAQQVPPLPVAPTPAVPPPSVPLSNASPLPAPAQGADIATPKPSRVPPPVPLDEGPDLSAAGSLQIPPPPSYPPPPPPVDQDAADLAQGASLPVQAAASSSRVTLTTDEIDQMISQDFMKAPAWTAETADKRSAPNYTEADSYSNTSAERQGQDSSKQDRRAVEMRMIETREIQPRQEHIAKLEQQLADLHQTYGAGSTRPEIAALNEELNQLYEEVDVYEARVAALQESLRNDLPKDRLAAINQEQQAINASVEQKEMQPSVRFGGDVKTDDGNPRQQHELTVSAGAAAQSFVGNVPAGGITPDDLANQIKASYKKAYEYDGPARADDDGRQVRVKAANDRKITPAEIDRVAADMQPVVDEVNELQAQIESLKAAEDEPGVADQIQGLKAQQAKLLTDYSNLKMEQAAAIKPDRVQQTPGLQTTSPDPQAVPGKSAMKQTASVETNPDTQNNVQQRQDRIDRLTTPQPTFRSTVRDNLSPAALKAKAVDLNAEGRLRDVDQDIQDKYKDLKTKLKDPTLTKADQVQVEAEMAKLKQAHPALEQLDRSSLGRNIHSGLRDAVQTASAVKDRVMHPIDTLNDVRSQLQGGARSLAQGVANSLPDRLKVASINRDLGKLDTKIHDLKDQLKQLQKERDNFHANQLGTLMNSRRDGRLGEECRNEVMARLEKHYGDLSGKSPVELAEMDMELTKQGLASFEEKIAALEQSIAKEEAKVEVLNEQKDAIKNKKNVSQDPGKAVKPKL